MNPILLTDSYKVTHWAQLPPKTEFIYSYMSSRGGLFTELPFVGLSYFLQKYFVTPVTKENIDEAENFSALHFGNKNLFNRAGWEYIVDKYGGRLPLLIKAVPEGMVVPIKNIMMTIENTDRNCAWLTNYVETPLSQLWYPTTVCALSRQIKKIIAGFLRETGDENVLDFKLHDFGFRGASSVESSAIGGFAHLVNFKGTDTMSALTLAHEFYGDRMAGFSIPAAEHSTITSWEEPHEVDAYRTT